MVKNITIQDFTTHKNILISEVVLTFQVFGEPLGTAEIVLVNHALTGNSQVSGENGWWKDLINYNKIINLHDYTVICFDIPNNDFAIEHPFVYDSFNTKDISKLFIKALHQLEIKYLYACIGSSLGGCIAWEMAFQQVDLIKNLIIVGSDWKATDWILAQCESQRTILENSSNPIADARKMAMLFYRTPESFKLKFNRAQTDEKYEIENWLIYHGDKLTQRFNIKAYKTMNYLLSTAGVSNSQEEFEQIISRLQCNVYQIGINTDLLFTAEENKITHKLLRKNNKFSKYFEIQSIHGHDAFLIEYKQLNMFLKHIFVNRFIV